MTDDPRTRSARPRRDATASCEVFRSADRKTVRALRLCYAEPDFEGEVVVMSGRGLTNALRDKMNDEGPPWEQHERPRALFEDVNADGDKICIGP